MSNPFNVVPQMVARNPVARAVSKKMLADALRHFQLRVHLMREGEDTSSDVDASIKALTACIFCDGACRPRGEHGSWRDARRTERAAAVRRQ